MPFQNRLGNGQSPLGAEPARAARGTFGLCSAWATLTGDPDSSLLPVIRRRLGEHRVDQDAGDEVGTSLRDADPGVDVGGFVHLR